MKARKTRIPTMFRYLFAFIIGGVIAYPNPPTIEHISNETGAVTVSNQYLNTTGGSITTMKLNATSQNLRWKAFVGNVEGTLTLDDGSGYTIFDWGTSTVGGVVYATRSSAAVNWDRLNCTWWITGDTTNRSVEEYENQEMNHTSIADNLTATFAQRDHSSFYVHHRQIQEDSCYAIHTYVNDTPQSTDFEEVLLYDGTNLTDGSIVYATILEQDKQGFDNESYDFQMIVPENGAQGFKSSTAYYFYAELV
jgi:hypothetical protein